MREYFKSDIVRLSKKVESIKECCVYFLINDNDIVYVGFTTDLNYRLKTHKVNKVFDKFYDIKVEDIKSGLMLEKYYIQKFKPAYNVVHNENCIRKKTEPRKIKISPIINSTKSEVSKLIKDTNIIYRQSINLKEPEFITLLNAEKIDIKFNLLKNTYCKKVLNGISYFVINYNGDFYKAEYLKSIIVIFDNKEYILSGIYGELK